MRRLLAILLTLCCSVLSAQTYKIGDVYTAPDGSRGIVYYLHPDGSGGWVVALTDASTGCAWGSATDVPGLANQSPSYNQPLLNDTAGYANTQALRNYQNNSTTYAAGKVDFAHGWVLPSPAQLSMLYGQLPFIASAITGAGGTALASNNYWCSAEKNASNAWYVAFTSGYLSSNTKTSSCRVRAVRSFSNTAVVYDTALTYQWNTGSTQPYINVSPSQTTTYTVTATTDFGCSNTAEQTIVVSDGLPQTVYDTVCQGAGYEANGFSLTEAETGMAGTLVRGRTLETTGCSSTLTLQLLVRATADTVINQTACENYTWNGVTYYESGDYTQTFTAANGCDSVVTLNLTINHGTHNVETETACENYTWHGETYTVTGTYTYSYTNGDGCPSVDTLHLTVNYVSDSTINVSVMEDALPYILNGESYDTSGTYYQTLTNASGCDSMLTIVLSVITTFLPDNVDSANCVFFPDGTEWGIQTAWQSENIVSVLNTPLVAIWMVTAFRKSCVLPVMATIALETPVATIICWCLMGEAKQSKHLSFCPAMCRASTPLHTVWCVCPMARDSSWWLALIINYAHTIFPRPIPRYLIGCRTLTLEKADTTGRLM